MKPRSYTPWPTALALAAFALCVGACARQIGDGCSQNIDCSLNGDRQCDLSNEPISGGSCTILQCYPDQCPDNALCMEFESYDTNRAARRCMKSCNHDSDCRGNYVCRQPTVQANVSADPCPPAPTDGSQRVCNRLLDRNRPANQPSGYCILDQAALAKP